MKEGYYIAVGEFNHYYTLRYRYLHKVYAKDALGRGYEAAREWRSHHVRNLSVDPDRALAAAKEAVGHFLPLPNVETDAIRSHRAINWNVMRFGKYAGKTVEEIDKLDRDYLIYAAAYGDNFVPNRCKKNLEAIRRFVPDAEVKALVAEWDERDRKWKAEKEERIAAIEAKKARSGYVGEVGDRLDLTVECVKVITVETNWGLCWLHLFEDESDNVFKWFTSSCRLEEGPCRIRGTVKGHEEYEGTKNTVLTRVKEV